MKKKILTSVCLFSLILMVAQNDSRVQPKIENTNTITLYDEVHVDGRIQPLLNDFFDYCKKYDIAYEDKFFQLQSISIVNTLPLSENNTVLGKVLRDDYGNINKIVINWATLFDKEILKVVVFHELAHHFLDYKHTCHDCNEIMATTNSSYFDIVRDWDSQVKQLFTTSPVYLNQKLSVSNTIAAH